MCKIWAHREVNYSTWAILVSCQSLSKPRHSNRGRRMSASSRSRWSGRLRERSRHCLIRYHRWSKVRHRCWLVRVLWTCSTPWKFFHRRGCPNNRQGEWDRTWGQDICRNWSQSVMFVMLIIRQYCHLTQTSRWKVSKCNLHQKWRITANPETKFSKSSQSWVSLCTGKIFRVCRASLA